MLYYAARGRLSIGHELKFIYTGTHHTYIYARIYIRTHI